MNPPRIRVGTVVLANGGLQTHIETLHGRTGSEHHERLDGLSADRIWPPHDGHLGHGRIARDDALDVGRRDAVPGGEDDIVLSRGEEELPTAMPPDIPREVPVTRPGVSGDRIPWKDLSYGTSQ